MKQTEFHHLEPVSLGGRDIKENILELDHDIHVMLHQILDLPSRLYINLTRQYRIASNHHIVQRPESIDRLADMQRIFFSNLHKLPTTLQKQHIQKMQEMQQLDYRIYKEFTNDTLDNPNPKGTDKEKFFEYHRASKEVQKEIAKEILKSIQTKYYIS